MERHSLPDNCFSLHLHQACSPSTSCFRVLKQDVDCGPLVFAQALLQRQIGRFYLIAGIE